MLYLSRNKSQNIMVTHEGVTITINVKNIYDVDANGRTIKQVMLGFDCPKSVQIWREEIYNKINNEKKLNEDKNLT